MSRLRSRMLMMEPVVGDSTPGGAASALLLENGFGLLLEDGTYLLLEA